MTPGKEGKMFHHRYQKSISVFALVIGACSLLGALPVQAGSKTSIAPLIVIATGAKAPGTGSILVRTKEGVGATVHASGLVPGNVYTLWLGIYNKPKACATTPCSVPGDLMNPAVQGVLLFGAGQIAGEDGTVDFGAFRAVGDPSGKAEGPPATAEALERPFQAQIHLAVRSHGPVIPGMLTEQLSTFNGGCSMNMCETVQVAPHYP
jgi:hypothetical protein